MEASLTLITHTRKSMYVCVCSDPEHVQTLQIQEVHPGPHWAIPVNRDTPPRRSKS